MAAPLKVGLDYFPFSVDLLDDEALERVRDEYGMIANEVYISTLCYLYKHKGYYIPYSSDKEKADLHWYIYKHVKGGKYAIKQEVVPRVIEACVAQGLFSGELYPKIITSERAQRTYYSATVDRTAVDINPDFWLINDNDMRKLSQKHPYFISIQKNNKSDEKPNKSDEKPNKSDDLPLNKIKLNEIKVNKEVSKKDKKISLPTYERVMEDFNVTGLLKEALFRFIQHLLANGIVLINDRLENIIIKLDFRYQTDDNAKIKEINDAIRNGYKRLPCES